MTFRTWLRIANENLRRVEWWVTVLCAVFFSCTIGLATALLAIVICHYNQN